MDFSVMIVCLMAMLTPILAVRECERSPPRMDRAWLTVIPQHLSLLDGIVLDTTNPKLSLFAQIDMCWKCPLIKVADIPLDKNCSMLIDTRTSQTLAVHDENDTVLWKIHTTLNEYGEYGLYIFKNSNKKIAFNFVTQYEAPDSNISIYVGIGVFVALALFSTLVACICRSRHEYFQKATTFCVRRERLVNEDLGSPEDDAEEEREPDPTPPPQPTSVRRERLRSLDTFRGFSLCIMIFVNYGGGGYWFFNHSAWNGLTVADLVFPWFTWIIGTSIALSFSGLLRRGVTRRQLVSKVLQRTVILFSLGIVLQTNGGSPVDVKQMRIPGVLQRLAVSYAVVALLQTAFASVDDPHRHKRWAFIRDVVQFWPEWIIMLALLALHLLIMFLLPVPGCPTGYFGPGGISEKGMYENCTGGAALVVDKWIFSEDHIYHSPTCKELYQTGIYEPEGSLGTLTSIFMCFLGLQAGKILVIHKDYVDRGRRWLIWAAVTGLIAGVLCKFSQNDGYIPVNKNLWSVSFIFALASMAFALLTLFYMLIDVYNVWSGAPFYFPGMNSIVVYTLHETFHNAFPVSFTVPDTHAAKLPLHLWGVVIWVTLSAVMYYKQVFISI